MSSFVAPPLDFTVVREDWGRYDLADNAILKVKTILTKIFKNQSNSYSVDFQNIVIVLTNERGNPDPRIHSQAEIQAATVRDDMRYTTVSQDWNEYVADDGARVKIQPIVMRVAKTSLFNTRGEPVYFVEAQATFQVRPPRSTT